MPPLTLTVRGDEAVIASINKLSSDVAKTEVLHKRLGVAGRVWVIRNFQDGGRPRWKPLRPNTVAARRKGSSKPLQDTGLLRQSYAWEADASKAVVGSPRKTALWHNEGTSPYTIRPKTLGGRLAFMTAGGMVFAKQVNHPGLPARRMLPTRKQAIDDILEPVTDQFLKDAIRSSFGRTR